ncbi:MAG: TonB-dependent receptor [Verrucomicrobiota bacterium]
MNLDLLIRLFPILTLAALLPAFANAQNDGSEEEAEGTPVVSTLTDPTATLDLTLVSGARSVVIREENVQQSVVPNIATRTVLTTEEEETRALPSVDTISGAELRTYQRYDIASILRQSAGVSVTSLGGEGSQTSIFIRGMESDHTVVLLNGRRIPRGLGGQYQIEFLDVSNLESFQLSRGPASSLYGSDALAGAIDLRIADARFVGANTLSTYFEGGSFDTFRSGGKITLREGRLGISLDASYVDTENDRVFDSTYENKTVRGNVAYEFGDGIFLDILGSVQDSFLDVLGQRSVAGVPRAAFPVTQTNANQSGLFSPRFSIIRDTWDFSTFYSYTTNVLEDRNSPGFFGNIDARFEQTGQEWESQFNYRPSKDVTLTVGGGHYDYHFERTPLVATAAAPAELEYAFSSFFAQADIALPANFYLLTSGRYDDYDIFDSQGTYTAQLSHVIERTGTTLFGKVATGYKPPNGTDLTNNLFLNITASDLIPEESFTYEFGVSQEICDGKGVVSLTYFNNEIDNLIDNLPGAPFSVSQVDTESEGFEFELRTSLTENINLYANYTYLDANVVNGTYLTADPAGSRLIRRPRHTIGAGMVYTADRWQVGAEINGAYDRVDRGAFPNQVDLGGYTVARVFGNFEVNDNFEVYGRIENAFDEQYDFSDGYEAPGLGAFVGARIYLGGSPESTGYAK